MGEPKPKPKEQPGECPTSKPDNPANWSGYMASLHASQPPTVKEESKDDKHDFSWLEEELPDDGQAQLTPPPLLPREPGNPEDTMRMSMAAAAVVLDYDSD